MCLLVLSDPLGNIQGRRGILGHAADVNEAQSQNFGLDGVKAVGTELKKLHDLTAVKPKNANELTAQERWEAMA